MSPKFHMDPDVVNQFLNIALAVAPAALALVPNGKQFAPLVPLLAGAMALVQALPDAPGSQKKAIVQQLVRIGVQATNATGKVELDLAAIDAIADNSIDAIVAGINETQRAVAAAKGKK